MAALTDFSERRQRYFPNLSRATYTVVERTKHGAVVIEGTGPFRTKERYEWKTKGVIRSEVLESSVFEVGSMTEIRVRPLRATACRVEGTVARGYVGRGGRVLSLMVLVNGRSRFFKKLYLRVLKNIRREGRREAWVGDGS